MKLYVGPSFATYENKSSFNSCIFVVHENMLVFMFTLYSYVCAYLNC